MFVSESCYQVTLDCSGGKLSSCSSNPQHMAQKLPEMDSGFMGPEIPEETIEKRLKASLAAGEPLVAAV